MMFNFSDFCQYVSPEGVGVMFAASLVPDAFYWARPLKRSDGCLTVAPISTVFGVDPDYWTLALLGSDQHQMIGDYEIVALAEPPEDQSIRLAAE
jgi:hypothetical protein